MWKCVTKWTFFYFCPLDFAFQKAHTSSSVIQMTSFFAKHFADVAKIMTTGAGFAALYAQQQQHTKDLMDNAKTLNQTIVSADRRVARFAVLKEFDQHPCMAAAARLLDPETTEGFHPIPPSVSETKSIYVSRQLMQEAMGENKYKKSRYALIVCAIMEQWIAYFNDLNGMVERGEVEEEDIVKEALIEWMQVTKNNKWVFQFGMTTHYFGDASALRYPGFGKLFKRWGLVDSQFSGGDSVTHSETAK